MSGRPRSFHRFPCAVHRPFSARGRSQPEAGQALAQDRVVRAGDQDVRTELDADGGKEPFQQPRLPGCGLCAVARSSGCPCSKTVAVSQR